MRLNIVPKLSPQTKAFIAVLIAAVFGGSIAVLAKIGLRVVPPVTFTFLRFAIASVILSLMVGKLPAVEKKYWIRAIGISVFATMNVTLFAFGARYTTAIVSQLLYAIVPVLSAVIIWFLYRKAIGVKKSIGIVLGFSGVVTLLFLPLLQHGAEATTGTVYGNGFIFLATLSFTIYSVFSKQLHRFFTALQLTLIFAMTTTVLLFPFVLVDFIQHPGWVAQINLESVVAVIGVGVFGGALYYYLYQYAIKNGGSLLASLVTYLQPVTTSIWSSLLLHEYWSLPVFLGALVALLGAWLVAAQEQNNARTT